MASAFPSETQTAAAPRVEDDNTTSEPPDAERILVSYSRGGGSIVASGGKYD